MLDENIKLHMGFGSQASTRVEGCGGTQICLQGVVRGQSARWHQAWRGWGTRQQLEIVGVSSKLSVLPETIQWIYHHLSSLNL